MTVHKRWSVDGLEAEYAQVETKDLLERLNISGRWAYYGFAVRPGWLPILEQMFGDMIEAGWDRTGLDQIKQKFGTLRISLEGAHPVEVHDVIDDHEAMGQITCELCGEVGFPRTIAQIDRKGRSKGGYVITLCDEHYAAVENPQKEKR